MPQVEDSLVHGCKSISRAAVWFSTWPKEKYVYYAGNNLRLSKMR